MSLHNPIVRSCIEIMPAGFPRDEYRDDIRCPRCDENHTAMHLDPDIREILTREPWCESCSAGHKPQLSQAEYDRKSQGSES